MKLKKKIEILDPGRPPARTGIFPRLGLNSERQFKIITKQSKQKPRKNKFVKTVSQLASWHDKLKRIVFR
jgi:hypothetical protein